MADTRPILWQTFCSSAWQSAGQADQAHFSTPIGNDTEIVNKEECIWVDWPNLVEFGKIRTQIKTNCTNHEEILGKE